MQNQKTTIQTMAGQVSTAYHQLMNEILAPDATEVDMQMPMTQVNYFLDMAADRHFVVDLQLNLVNQANSVSFATGTLHKNAAGNFILTNQNQALTFMIQPNLVRFIAKH